jgi:transglutaminase-like putative cysteine protease
MEQKSTMLPDKYLGSSPMSDCDNAKLKRTATELVKGIDTPLEAALQVFKYIRDEIAFNATLDIYLKASEALEREIIDYCNKINIHVSLLRAIGIPARYHTVRVKKEVLAHIVPGFLYSRLPSPVGHFWCECYVNGRWVACEALYDQPFYEGMLKSGWVTKEQIPTITWDGKSNLVLMKAWIVEDSNIYAYYEEIVSLAREEGMPPKMFCKVMEWLPVYFSSKRTEKVRKL